MSVRKSACRPPMSTVSPPPSLQLIWVLDIGGYGRWVEFFADSLARYGDAGDDITVSFKPMESDDAAEERVSQCKVNADFGA